MSHHTNRNCVLATLGEELVSFYLVYITLGFIAQIRVLHHAVCIIGNNDLTIILVGSRDQLRQVLALIVRSWGLRPSEEGRTLVLQSVHVSADHSSSARRIGVHPLLLGRNLVDIKDPQLLVEIAIPDRHRRVRHVSFHSY